VPETPQRNVYERPVREQSFDGLGDSSMPDSEQDGGSLYDIELQQLDANSD
jgi:hypothetical protein